MPYLRARMGSRQRQRRGYTVSRGSSFPWLSNQSMVRLTIVEGLMRRIYGQKDAESAIEPDWLIVDITNKSLLDASINDFIPYGILDPDLGMIQTDETPTLPFTTVERASKYADDLKSIKSEFVMKPLTEEEKLFYLRQNPEATYVQVLRNKQERPATLDMPDSKAPLTLREIATEGYLEITEKTMRFGIKPCRLARRGPECSKDKEKDNTQDSKQGKWDLGATDEEWEQLWRDKLNAELAKKLK